MSYLHRHFLDQVPLIWVIKGDAVLWSPIYNQFSQHGALLSDLFSQTASVNTWKEKEENNFKSLSFLVLHNLNVICCIKGKHVFHIEWICLNIDFPDLATRECHALWATGRVILLNSSDWDPQTTLRWSELQRESWKIQTTEENNMKTGLKQIIPLIHHWNKCQLIVLFVIQLLID